jgi:lipopolysaccharide/colanic/teichoic acid biosynthesis glycosyltransferase
VTIFGLTSDRWGTRAWRFLRPASQAQPAELLVPSDQGQWRRRSDTDRTTHVLNARPVEARPARRQMMNAEVFRTVLVRERKRADRSNRPFIVLLLSQDAIRTVATGWDESVDALVAAKRDTDVLGWFESGTTIGLIVPEVDGETSSVARELEHRVRTELAKRLDARVAAAISLTLHAHTPQPKAVAKSEREDAGPWPVEPLLEKAAPRHRRACIHAAFKRALDIAGSAALLTLLAPVFLVIAVLVKVKSPGPVFFRQKRIGEKGQPFLMLKFRSMYVNADNAIHQQYVNWFITASDQEKSAKGGIFKLTHDPRITPIGRVLRRTSLDELPQFWNVLRGDMSLVGPRPPLEYEVQKYAPWHCRRVLDAKPGITGLWQVTGRSSTTFDEMVRLDLRYARKPSIWTDIKILLATPRAVIMGRGAC